jgi:TIGR03009 family protein
MPRSTRYAAAALPVWLLFAALAIGQQPPGVPAAPQALPPVGPPPEFHLNQVQQAQLDQVLDTWQRESGKISTFKCSFERWDYNLAFGPAPDIPLNKDKGELSYGKPDKGSFQITEIHAWQATPVPPGQPPPAQVQGNWVHQPDAVGEHWVCDGKSIFEYRHQQKQLVERPIPPQMRGQAIIDGPLPFLFGAQPAKLKARYWMRIDPSPNPNQIWLVADPKHQAQAADFKRVRVILDRHRLLPTHMQVEFPNGSRHMYVFDVANATVNSPLQQLMSFFQRPRLPSGWKRIVEPMPVAQAAPPMPPPR